MNTRRLIGITATTLVLVLSLVLLGKPDNSPRDSDGEPVPYSGRNASVSRFYPGTDDVPGTPTQVRMQDGAPTGAAAIIPAVQRERETRHPVEPPSEPV